MKILIDARLYGLENAGLGRYTLNLVQELADLDSDNKYTILLRKKYFNRLKLPNNWKKVLADFRHYSIKEQLLLPKIIREEKPDISHFPHFNVPILLKGKFVVTIHDLLMHKFKGKEATTKSLPFYYPKRLGYYIAFKKAVESSSSIISPSKAVKEDIERNYDVGEKVNVVYEGFNDVFKSQDTKSVLSKYDIEHDYFVYVGNAYPHKNLDRVIEAVVLLNKQSKKKVQFVVVSSKDEFTKRLERKIENHGAGGLVRLLGFVPDEDLASLYSTSKGLLYASVSEGFGLQGLEAMASGTLVVCSNIPVFKEVYKDNAIYFNPFDFTAIKDAMRDTLDMSDKKRQKRIKKAKSFVEKYSWRKMAKETLEVYEKTLGGKAS